MYKKNHYSPTNFSTDTMEESNFFCRYKVSKDFDEITELFREWKLTSTQLTAGAFEGETWVARCGYLIFGFSNFNQSMQIVGEKLANHITFSVLLSHDNGELISHNQCLNSNFLFGFDMNRCTYLVTPQSTNLVTIGVNREVFQEYIDQLESDKFNDQFLSQNIIHVMPDRLNKLKAYLHQILYILQTNPAWLGQKSIERLIIQDFLPLLIETMWFDVNLSIPTPVLKRHQIIRELETFTSENLAQPLTLKDLYTAIHTSPRTLSSAIQEVFGMSPMAYLKVKRLNGVRRAIKKAEPDEKTISHLANEWGFWSMGHFSQDYKKLFGESPSQHWDKNLV